MPVTITDFYRSSNGDRWQLIHDGTTRALRGVARAKSRIGRPSNGDKRG